MHIHSALHALATALDRDNIPAEAFMITMPFRDFLQLQLAVQRDTTLDSNPFRNLSDTEIKIGRFTIESDPATRPMARPDNWPKYEVLAGSSNLK